VGPLVEFELAPFAMPCHGAHLPHGVRVSARGSPRFVRQAIECADCLMWQHHERPCRLEQAGLIERLFKRRLDRTVDQRACGPETIRSGRDPIGGGCVLRPVSAASQGDDAGVTSVGVLEAVIAPGTLRVDVADKANYEFGQVHASGEPLVSWTWIGVGCVAVELPDDLTRVGRVILEVADERPSVGEVLSGRVELASGDLFLEEIGLGARVIDVTVPAGSYQVCALANREARVVRVVLFERR
jgi:hypothetical protein